MNKLVYPVKQREITSEFGWRWDGSDWHSGVDYIPSSGDFELYSIDNGVIRKVGNDEDGYGKYLVIEHDGFCSLLAHCNSIYVEVGQFVSQGERVALMGNTGHSFGRHLHFEIRDVRYKKFWEKMSNDEYTYCVDPEKFIMKFNQRTIDDIKEELDKLEAWEKKSWIKAYLTGRNDGKDPRRKVDEAYLMVWADKMGLLGPDLD